MTSVYRLLKAIAGLVIVLKTARYAAREPCHETASTVPVTTFPPFKSRVRFSANGFVPGRRTVAVPLPSRLNFVAKELVLVPVVIEPLPLPVLPTVKLKKPELAWLRPSSEVNNPL